jgi:Flp pilus assembly protein TadD
VIALALLVLTVLVLRSLRRRPYLASGWLWFLGTLVPVIGLVQVGSQALADRYAYLPTIGLYVLVAWGVRDLLARAGKGARGAVFAGAVVVLVALALTTRAQIAHWRDSEALWRRAVAVTRNNYVAHNALGLALQRSGQLDEAEAQFQAALGVKINYLQAHVNLARLLAQRGDVDGAISQYQRAIFIRPRYAPAHNNLGGLLHNLGRSSEARRHVERALECNPRLPEAHANMAMIALAEGLEEEAARHFRSGFELKPPHARAASRFAWLLATSKDDALRNGVEAMHWARYGAEASEFEDPDSLAALAAACAEVGDFDEAVRWQRRAIDLAADEVGELRHHLALYESRRPLRR